MIFPVPIPFPMPMYMPGMSNAFRMPSISTHKIESELSGIAGGIREISEKLDKKDICINTDTDALLPVMAWVGPWVVRELEAYEKRYSEFASRFNKIDEWKRKRAKKKKQRELEEKEFRVQEARLWNEALQQDAEFNYKNQPRGRWWKGWVEKSYSDFLHESGYKPEKQTSPKKEREFDRLQREHMRILSDHYESDFEWRWRKNDSERLAKKPQFHSMFPEIIKLHTICEQIRGASISIPSDLMQAVSVIARNVMSNTLEGKK